MSMNFEGKKYSHKQEKKVEWLRMDIKDGVREWKWIIFTRNCFVIECG